MESVGIQHAPVYVCAEGVWQRLEAKKEEKEGGGKERGRKEGRTQKINNDSKAAWVQRTVHTASWAEFPLVPSTGCGTEVGSRLDF